MGVSALALAASALGAGVTALPGAVAASGFLGGNALILCVAVANGWTLSCLCACAKRSGCESYPSLAGHYLGRSGRLLAAANLILLLFAGVVICARVACDVLTPLLVQLSRFTDGEPLRIRRAGLGAGLLIAVAPLCLSDSLHGVRHASVGALACHLYLAGVLATRLASAWGRGLLPWLEAGREGSFFGAVKPAGVRDTLAVLGVAFCAQFSVLQVYAELSRPTLRRASAAIATGMGAVLLVNATVANAGYLLLGDAGTPADILGDCFPDEDLPMGVARAALGVSLVLKVPILMVPLVQALAGAQKDLLSSDGSGDNEVGEDDDDGSDEHFGSDEDGSAGDALEAPLLPHPGHHRRSSARTHSVDELGGEPSALSGDGTFGKLGRVAGTLGATWVCACAFPDASAVLHVVGNTCNCVANYILPSTLYLLSDLHRGEGAPVINASHTLSRSLDRLKALACLLLGLAVLVNFVASIA